MKAYFTASINAGNKFIEQYKTILQALKKNNQEVIFDKTLIQNQSETIQSAQERHYEFLSHVEKSIKSSDFLVVETSNPSVSMGYEIAEAMQEGKPIIALHDKKNTGQLAQLPLYAKLITMAYTIETLDYLIPELLAQISSIL